MSEENNENPPENPTPPEKKSENPPVNPKPEEKDDLAPLKEKLNGAYAERDAAREELAAMKQAQRDAEIAALKEQGKTQEAYEAQLSDRDTEIATLKARIVELTRDNSVRAVLSTYKLKNERAVELAYDSIVKELVQNEKGDWVHRSGKSIKDYVKAFSEDEENEFLFEKKVNRGSGDPPTTTTPTKPTPPRGGKLPTDPKEVLRLAREGKLPNQRK